MDLRFKQTGIKILQSKFGDLLIVDPRFKTETMITKSLIDLTKEDDQKLLIFARQILNFLSKHDTARWEKVEAKLFEIKKTDSDFFKNAFRYVNVKTLENLHKLEKDIYFWEQNQTNYTKLDAPNYRGNNKITEGVDGGIEHRDTGKEAIKGRHFNKSDGDFG